MADASSRADTCSTNQAVVKLVDRIDHHEDDAMSLALELLHSRRRPLIPISAGDGAQLEIAH